MRLIVESMSAVARSSLADVSKRPFGRRASGLNASSFLLMGIAIEMAVASRLLAHSPKSSKRGWFIPPPCGEVRRRHWQRRGRRDCTHRLRPSVFAALPIKRREITRMAGPSPAVMMSYNRTPAFAGMKLCRAPASLIRLDLLPIATKAFGNQHFVRYRLTRGLTPSPNPKPLAYRLQASVDS